LMVRFIELVKHVTFHLPKKGILNVTRNRILIIEDHSLTIK
jgi:hypothetical protein